VAAGIVIVHEAGGFVRSLAEGGDPMDGDIIAANADIFERFASVIRG
jgi:myo-inositol-1(or 4)-monophosphatase